MADSNRTRLSFIKEATFNVIPATPAWNRVRWTGESFKMTTATKTSDEIRDDRQVDGFYRMGLNTEGGINIEVSYGTFDKLLEGLLYSGGWSTGATVTGCSVATNIITKTGAFGAYVVGQWVRTYGFATAINNGIFKITAIAANTLTVAGATFTTESGGTTQLGEQIVNGVTQSSYAWERYNTDLSTGGYSWFTGNILNTASFNFAAGELITGTIGNMGCTETGGDAAVASSTYNAAPTTRSMSAVENVYAIYENGVKTPVKTFSLSLANNARARTNIGSLFADDMGQGEIAVSGNLTAYLRDASLLNKYRNFTESAIAIAMRDGANNAYVFDVPTIKYGDGPANATGKNVDVMSNMSWNAYVNATEQITLRVVRFAAP